MKLALIPPRSQLNTSTGTGYHLLLPQHCNDQAYYDHYQRMRANGDFLMLDNGAAECVEFAIEDIMRYAHQYMVNEVVIPDTLQDWEASLKSVRAFEKYASENSQFNYMAVVQGRSWEELEACAGDYGWIDYVDTIAIPRHVESTVAPGTRLHMVKYISEYVGGNIHLLGTNPEHMNELGDLGDIYRAYNVRGIDTASPYYYAMGHSVINHGTVYRRPDDYFTKAVLDPTLVEANIALMKSWVYGDERRGVGR